MPTQISPLRVLSVWFRQQPTEVSEMLSYMSLCFAGNPQADDSDKGYLAWLSEELDTLAHAGRALSACAYIDYVMEEFGSDEGWKEKLETQLEMVERVPADLKPALNRGIGRHEEHKGLWMKAAQEWWKLRAMELHNDALRLWIEAAA